MLCLSRNLHVEVHKVLCLPRNLHIEVHQVLCPPQNLHFEVHQVLCLPGNLHFKVHQVLRLPRNLQTSHMSKSHDSLHLSRTLRSLTITTMSKVLCLPQKTAFRSITAPSPCTCHEKSTLEHQNTRFPLQLPRKVTIMCGNARDTTTRAQSR